jgi:hypothetical protein
MYLRHDWRAAAAAAERKIAQRDGSGGADYALQTRVVV